MEKTMKKIESLLSNNEELMVVAGIAAVVVIGGAIYLIKKNGKKEKVEKEKISERLKGLLPFRKNKEVESK